MDNESNYFYRVMCAVILLTASIPLACGYIMDGGTIHAWTARIEEMAEGLRQGRWILYPSVEALAPYGRNMDALHSNFWLFLPALIRWAGGNIVSAYRIFLLLVNIATLYAAARLFGRLFEDKWTALSGILFYMTSPYRIWVCYEQADLGETVAWMLVPLFLWGMLGIFAGGVRWREVVVSALALAGVGYADGIMFLIAVGCAVLGAAWYKRGTGLIPVFLGGALYLPAGIRLMGYLGRGGLETWNLPLQSIMKSGYALGQFFSSYVYQGGRPGMGLGLLGALLALMWLSFAEGGQGVMKKYGFPVAMSLLFLGMSLSCFPWDCVQRVHVVFMRLVSLMETPGIFFGFASLFLCVPAAYGVECLRRQERKFVRTGIPVMIFLGTLGVATYLCNTLTFTRMPLLGE